MTSSSQLPTLSVIVISYNTREMTLRCLSDLYADLEGIDAEVLVIDNASQDGSADAIENIHPQVRLIRNESNVGFGAANNQALEIAKGRYLLMLNTDAFLHKGCCPSLVNFLEMNPGAGVVGARLLNEDGSLQVSCFPFPTPLRYWIENLWIPKVVPTQWRWGDYRRWNHSEDREVDWVVGACLVCRREVVDAVGGYDPAFFMYQEETDWQQRIRRAGWKIFFTPTAVATHLGGASGTNHPTTINKYFYTSMDKYMVKHHGLAGFFLMRSAIILGIALRLPLWAVVFLTRNASRPQAKRKIQLYTWLIKRELTVGPP